MHKAEAVGSEDKIEGVEEACMLVARCKKAENEVDRARDCKLVVLVRFAVRMDRPVEAEVAKQQRVERKAEEEER